MEREKDKSSNKTIKIIGSVLLGAGILVVVTLLFAFTDIKTVGFSENQAKPYSSFLEEDLLKDYPDCPEKVDRGYLPRKMFCQLPDLPSNYKSFKVLYDKGTINDLEIIPEDVWSQPEFSSAWTGQILGLLQNPQPSRIGAAYYPQVDNTDSGIKISQGRQGRVNFMIRNTPLSIFFLGVKLVPSFPKTQILEYESIKIETTQDPEIASKCFDVKITPNEFALAPSFPVFIYGEEGESYMQMVRVEIEVSDDCPKGDYIIAVNPVTPSNEFSDEYMLKQFRGQEILTKYAKVGGYVGIDRPFFRAFVTVE